MCPRGGLASKSQLLVWFGIDVLVSPAAAADKNRRLGHLLVALGPARRRAALGALLRLLLLLLGEQLCVGRGLFTDLLGAVNLDGLAVRVGTRAMGHTHVG